MKRNLQIIGGVVEVLVGLGFIMPAVAQLRTQGALPALSIALLLLGVFLSLGGGWACSPPCESRRLVKPRADARWSWNAE